MFDRAVFSSRASIPLWSYDPGFSLALGWRPPPVPEGHRQFLEDADSSGPCGLSPQGCFLHQASEGLAIHVSIHPQGRTVHKVMSAVMQRPWTLLDFAVPSECC